MKEQMKRTVYEAPLTELFQIELEGAFMSGSIVSGDTTVETTGHELNEIDITTIEDHTWNDYGGWE
mgnify:CR=1 FL=1